MTPTELTKLHMSYTQQYPRVYTNTDGELSDSDYHNPCCHLWIGREHRECGGDYCLTEYAKLQEQQRQENEQRVRLCTRFDQIMQTAVDKHAAYSAFMSTLTDEQRQTIHDYEDECEQPEEECEQPIRRAYTCTASELRHMTDPEAQKRLICRNAKEFEDDLVRLNFNGIKLSEKYVLDIPDTPWALHIDPHNEERYAVSRRHNV